jgi:hypothetical protein
MTIFEPKFTYTQTPRRSRTCESQHEFQTKWRGGFLVYDINRQTDGALFDWMRDNMNNLEPLNSWVKKQVERVDFSKPWGSLAVRLPKFIFGNPKYQRGSVTFMQQAGLLAQESGEVFISSASYTSQKTRYTGPHYFRLELRTNGQLFANDGSVTTGDYTLAEVNGQWWTKEPQVNIGNLYKPRYTNILNALGIVSNDSVGSGVYSADISVDRIFQKIRISKAGPGLTTGTFGLDIADVGSSTIRDSAVITYNILTL